MRKYMRRTADGFVLSIILDSCVWAISHGTIKDNHFIVSANNHELLSVNLTEVLELAKTIIAKPSVV